MLYNLVELASRRSTRWHVLVDIPLCFYFLYPKKNLTESSEYLLFLLQRVSSFIQFSCLFKYRSRPAVISLVMDQSAIIKSSTLHLKCESEWRTGYSSNDILLQCFLTGCSQIKPVCNVKYKGNNYPVIYMFVDLVA